MQTSNSLRLEMFEKRDRISLKLNGINLKKCIKKQAQAVKIKVQSNSSSLTRNVKNEDQSETLLAFFFNKNMSIRRAGLKNFMPYQHCDCVKNKHGELF